jgi:cob(I)alamin adenosyltransferase
VGKATALAARNDRAGIMQRPTGRSNARITAARPAIGGLFLPRGRRLAVKASSYAGPMVNLTRIYTRTGDDGTTALGDFSRTSKNDPRLVAYADVDEANSAIGVVLAMGARSEPGGGIALDPRIVELLRRVQNDLFDVGADLCTPLTTTPPRHPALRITTEYVEWLEAACDIWNADLPALRSFILPGGTPGAAFLHVARTVSRRAERAVWAAIEAYGTNDDGGVNPLTARYLNRLSDLLFILCRAANGSAGDVLWVPGGEG